MKFLFNRIFFICLLFLSFSGCLAQHKSTNIQKIDGREYYIHKIEKKQSLYSISKLYNVPLERIYELNPELSSGAKAGQEIRIPFAETTPIKPDSAATSKVDTNRYRTHVVQKGETIYSISRKYQLSEKQLLSYNPSLSDGLKEGQLIIVGEKTKSIQETISGEPDYTVKQEPSFDLLDSSLFNPVYKPTKNNYNVALMLPFRLDEAQSIDPLHLVRNNYAFPPVPALSVDFYLGFKRAVDSLSGNNFNIDLKLYDIDEDDTLQLSRMANDPQFGETDLIFGPLYASSFKRISRQAAAMRVPVVSPITQQNKILFNNIYVSKTNPSQFTLLESLADYCMDSLLQNRANLIVVTLGEKDKRELAYIAAFRSYFNQRRVAGVELMDTLQVVQGFTGLKSVYRPGVHNIVVTLCFNQVFITEFTTQLAMFAVKNDITLCGWQNVTEMDNIDQEYLNQLRYTFPHQFNLSNTAAYAPILSEYKNQQETLPGEYYYIGFDIAYYYLKNLRESGPGFVHRLDELPLETNYMRFKYARPDRITGFDNRGVFIFRYNNYQLQKTGWR